jgi:tRNA G18 (ribose-2'-O)-methylase SpoU
MKGEKQKTEKMIVGVLHDVRSLHNVGSMFRTADAGGVRHLYLTGYTPTPIDRFGRKRKEIAKTALGGEETVPWSTHQNLPELLFTLRGLGYQIVLFECGSPLGVMYDEADYGEKVALVMGNEVDGLSKELLDGADIVAEIPLHGSKESLNVSVAFGVALYGIRRGETE